MMMMTAMMMMMITTLAADMRRYRDNRKGMCVSETSGGET